MDYKNRVNVNVLNGQENIFANKTKTQNLKGGLQIIPTRRNVLGDICNLRVQPSLIGKSQEAAEKDRKAVGVRPPVRSYKNVQAKVDTRLPVKAPSLTAVGSNENSQKIFRREESTIALAAKAGVITARLKQTKISSANIKKTDSNENLIPKDKERKLRPITVKVDPEDGVKKVSSEMNQDREVESEDSISSYKKDSYSTELLDGVEDIDAGEEKNPILMAIYIKDIYSYLRDLETKFPIQPQHLDGQIYMTPKMRAMLIDWLVQVHAQFNLLLETLHLTVAIIDRYLQNVKTIGRVQIQLVGITAMFIASKYEEMFPPEITDYVHITDNTYTKRDILKCERSILVSLDFCLGRPLPLHFVRRLIKAANGTTREHFLAKYLVDLALVEYTMAHYRPSEIASAAVCLSVSLISPNISPRSCWTVTLSFYSGYTYRALSPLIKKLAGVLTAAETSRYKAVSEKYSSSKHGKVSKYPELAGAASRMK